MTKYIELVHTGAILKEEFLEPLSLSQNALAKAIGVPANRIHQIVKGDRRITADTDLRLTRYFELSEGYFLRLQEDYETRITKKQIAGELDVIIPHSKAHSNEVRAEL